MALGVDFGRRPRCLVGLDAAFRVDEVRCKERVDERRLAEAGLACEAGNAKQVGQLPRRCEGRLAAGARRASGEGELQDRDTRTDDDHIELKAALQELVLDLLRDSCIVSSRSRSQVSTSTERQGAGRPGGS
jgi:hypothetical protein